MIWGTVIAGFLASCTVWLSEAKPQTRKVSITWPNGTSFQITETREDGLFVFHSKNVDSIQTLVKEHSVEASCSISDIPSKYCVELDKWTRYGKDLDTSAGSLYQVDHDRGTGESKLTVKHATRENSTGEYAAMYSIGIESSPGVCTCDDPGMPCIMYHCNVNVNGDPFVKYFPNSIAVNEEDELKLECPVLGYPKPEVTWFINTDKEDKENADKYKKLDPAAADKRITITDAKGYKNAALSIKPVEFKDEGMYKCVASEPGGGKPYERSVQVRVKGKLAFLWPIIGIAGEVFLVAAIIFIKDIRQKRKEAAIKKRRDAKIKAWQESARNSKRNSSVASPVAGDPKKPHVGFMPLDNNGEATGSFVGSGTDNPGMTWDSAWAAHRQRNTSSGTSVDTNKNESKVTCNVSSNPEKPSAFSLAALAPSATTATQKFMEHVSEISVSLTGKTASASTRSHGTGSKSSKSEG